jgi:hypothetical protein
LIGKGASIPPKTEIGGNVIIFPWVKERDFQDRRVKAGETIKINPPASG